MSSANRPPGAGEAGLDRQARLSVPRTAGLPMVETACLYAEAGWFVLPVAQGSDDATSLLGTDWRRLSSRQRKALRRWFTRWPDAGVALHLGKSAAVAFLLEEGPFEPSDAVLDIMLEGFCFRPHDEPDQPRYVTALPEGTNLSASRAADLPGVARMLGESDILVVEPSPRPLPGSPAMWRRFGRMDLLSTWLINELEERHDEARQPKEAPATSSALGLGTGPDSERVQEVSLVAPSSTWAPVDFRAVLAGTMEPLTPSLMMRSDGRGLLYPGMVHTFFGEPESGKSLLMQWLSSVLLRQGEQVLYLDFESDERSVMLRLMALGATEKQLRKRFTYVRPEADVSKPHDKRAWRRLLQGSYALVVIDGVTEALDLFGYQSNDNDTVARWMRTVPRVLAENTGAAVALVDHVTKLSDGRGRYPVGAQAKLAAITGAAYAVEAKGSLMEGGEAEFILRVVKDRPGAVRPHASGGGRVPMIARAVITSRVPPYNGRALTVDLQPPKEDPATAQQPEPDSGFDDRALEAVTSADGITQTKLLERLGGNRPAATARLRQLVETGILRTEAGGRNARRYYAVDEH